MQNKAKLFLLRLMTYFNSSPKLNANTCEFVNSFKNGIRKFFSPISQSPTQCRLFANFLAFIGINSSNVSSSILQEEKNTIDVSEIRALQQTFLFYEF